jgi:NADH dehydrogenase
MNMEKQINRNNQKKIIIIGGGFAGLNIAKALEGKNLNILLIDKQNHHQFQPLFYQVATSQLEPSSISFPFRKVFQNSKNIQIRFGEVQQILPETNTVQTSAGNYAYDELIVATGCRTNYFGNKELEENSLPMKTTQEAIQIRNRILQSFEKLTYVEKDEREGLLNLVIVGGGPTGVELSGALAEIKSQILPKDFPGIDFSKLKIILLEGSPNTLNNMSSTAKAASKQYLMEMGVEVRTETTVNSYDGKEVSLTNGEKIPCKTLIWAAGITGNLIDGINKAAIVKGNRLIVDRFNLIYGHSNIYAVGDIAYMETPLYPKGHPQLANVAINQGKNLAKNMLKKLNGQKQNPYEYIDLGSMATIGKHKAVVDLAFIKFKGYWAWFVWMSLHLMLILSVRNKLIIFINWAWTYLTNDSSLRLILNNPFNKKEEK